MTRITDLHQDVEAAQDTVLGGLETDERIRMFLKASAEDRDDRIEMLRDSAPRSTYEMPDLEFTEGTKEVYLLSMLANHTLERLYTTILMHEAGRDKHILAILLNQALAELSQGHFTVDEYGNVDTPESWPNPHEWMDDTDTARLAGRYGELWAERDLELPPSFDERVTPYFAEMATAGLLGYRHKLDRLEDGLSRTAFIDEQLTSATAEFYVGFHTFHRLAEEHLDTTLDELLQATQAERSMFDASLPSGRIDEEACRDLLERKEIYLDAHEGVLEVLMDAAEEMDAEDTDVFAEDLGLSKSDLDTEVDECLEEIVAALDYAV